MDGADVCRTSSRASRRPPDVISTAAILDPRWRGRKWRHPGPGARFSTPIVEGGGKWRPFRFRSPSWMTSFAGTGNEVIQDGDRKRKGRHFPPPSTIGSKNAPYTTYMQVVNSYKSYGNQANGFYAANAWTGISEKLKIKFTLTWWRCINSLYNVFPG